MNDYFHFPKTSPAYAIIWLHGLGSSGDDMKSVASVLSLDGLFVRHVFLDAPARPVTINQGMVMPAWYDIYGIGLNERDDVEGIQASYLSIDQTIQALMRSGFGMHQIILAGFSQGAAMALYTALHCSQRLAGVVALSGYLPLASTLKPTLPRETPFFIGYGRYDTLVMPAWSQQTAILLKETGFQRQKVKDYPMEHHICPEEITDLSYWVKALSKE